MTLPLYKHKKVSNGKGSSSFIIQALTLLIRILNELNGP